MALSFLGTLRVMMAMRGLYSRRMGSDMVAVLVGYCIGIEIGIERLRMN